MNTSTSPESDGADTAPPASAADWDFGDVAVRALTGDREPSLVTDMVRRGMTDEIRLTNAIFFTRHPERVGGSLVRGSPLAGEWLGIRDQIVRPALASRRPIGTTAPETATTATATGSTAPQRSVFDQAYDVMSGLARRIYDAVTGDPNADDRPRGPLTPRAAEPAARTVGNATVVTVPSTPQPTTDTPARAGEKRFRTKQPTIEGSTLHIAETRTKRSTRYHLKGIARGDVNRMLSGALDATVFYCSGFSIWTLSAAGYDINKEVVGSDGVPYTWTKTITGKSGRKGTVEVAVTLKMLIDGEPPAVEAMSIAQQRGMDKGGSVGFLSGRGHAAAYSEQGVTRAVKGAAGAFAMTGIGFEVPESKQKPGDFAQAWRKSRGEKGSGDTELRYRGAGHAWQVWAVRAKGDAMFGETGSPIPEDRDLGGWHTNVMFVIDQDTDPAYVGVHAVRSAKRIEANVEKPEEGKPGGVAITGWLALTGTKSQTRIYYGRLSTSPWANWDENAARTQFGGP